MTAQREARAGTLRPGGRTARNRAAVLAAALEELDEYGYAGLSTARIADRAGVHRTTVHRRWPDHAELITEALIESAAAAVTVPDTGNVRDDLRELLGSIASLIDTPEARNRIRGLIADAARSPAIAEVVSRTWSARFEIGEAVVARGVARGELRDDLPPVTMLATFVGPLYVRLLITDQPIDDAFLDDVVDIGLRGAQE